MKVVKNVAKSRIKNINRIQQFEINNIFVWCNVKFKSALDKTKNINYF